MHVGSQWLIPRYYLLDDKRLNLTVLPEYLRIDCCCLAHAHTHGRLEEDFNPCNIYLVLVEEHVGGLQRIPINNNKPNLFSRYAVY